MILVDTSIWIDHLRAGDSGLVALLQDNRVVAHPWVAGEIALGTIAHRNEVLGLLAHLPKATVATDAEVMKLVDDRRLFGLGIGYVDAHLLAATLLTSNTRLWTRDKRLAGVAEQVGVAHPQGP